MSSEYMVGRVLDGRYEIVEKIGTGGMATVYKAKCRVLGRYVAIKILKDSLKYDSEIVKKFNAESRAAARLSHPNIVQVYDVSENGDVDYIVMELVEGITLKKYICEKGRLSENEACDIAAQIGRALECAHANGIVHRDIKPHNVLLTKNGVAKVADFGIAQATSGETVVAGKDAVGSVHYISPEQARGGFINERSDIYSLGVVLYEMLTGVVPFDGANPVAVALAKLEQEPVDLRAINYRVSDKTAEIVMKAISKEQHARYQTAAAMVADIESVMSDGGSVNEAVEERFETKRLENQNTITEHTSRRTEIRRRKRRNTRLTVLGIAAAVIIGIATYMFMTGGTQEYQVPDLTDLTVEEAIEVLKQANLRLNDEIEYEENDEFEEGHIFYQNPGINQFVKKNRKIKVKVSSLGGEKKYFAPEVENRKAAEAQKLIEAEGLKCTIVEEFSEKTEIGYVIKQSPKGGTELKEGDTVTIYVSGEEEQAIVPKITGKSREEAEAEIKAAGLSVGKVENRESDNDEEKVIEQSPAGGTGVEKGSSVNFTVSVKKEEQPQPTPKATIAPTPTQNPNSTTTTHTTHTTTTATPTPELKKKILTITIPDGESESVQIRAIANGREIYTRTHARSEKTVDIPVQASKDASVQVYIDGSLVADKVIQFD